MASAISLEVDGLVETLQATRGLEADLRRVANGELRKAAGLCATQLVGDLRSAAAGSGVPVASRVARSARVKSDRLPSVSLGGGTRAGRYGAPAAALLWGSEHGPRGEVNHFAVPPSSGYWIRPTVERFKGSGALQIYRTAVGSILRRWRLI